MKSEKFSTLKLRAHVRFPVCIPTHPHLESHCSVVELMEISIQPHRSEIPFCSDSLVLESTHSVYGIRGCLWSKCERLSPRNTQTLEIATKIVGAGIFSFAFPHTPHEQALIQFYFTLESG